MQLLAQQQAEIYVISQANGPHREKRKLISLVIIATTLKRQVTFSRNTFYDVLLHWPLDLC